MALPQPLSARIANVCLHAQQQHDSLSLTVGNDPHAGVVCQEIFEQVHRRHEMLNKWSSLAANFSFCTA